MAGAAAAPPPLRHSSAAVGQLAAASRAFTAALDTQKVRSRHVRI